MALNKKITILVFIACICCFLIILFITRNLSSKELDDLHPDIPCSTDLIEKSDVLWIIPKYNNHSIEKNPEFCNSIKYLNKTIGMHGVYHTFNEFSVLRDEKYMQQGITAFRKCLGFSPSLFKPPQLKYSSKNNILLKKFNLVKKEKTNQLLHKVYHCNDTGILSNKFIHLF